MAFLRRRKNAECINRDLRSPRALPWAMGNIWAYSPPQPFTRRFAQIIVFNRPFTGLVERLSYKHLFLRPRWEALFEHHYLQDSFHYPQDSFYYQQDNFSSHI